MVYSMDGATAFLVFFSAFSEYLSNSWSRRRDVHQRDDFLAVGLRTNQIYHCLILMDADVVLVLLGFVCTVSGAWGNVYRIVD